MTEKSDEDGKEKRTKKKNKTCWLFEMKERHKEIHGGMLGLRTEEKKRTKRDTKKEKGELSDVRKLRRERKKA